MDRRRFIKLTGLASLAVLTASDALAALVSSEHRFIDIAEPMVHVRHGFFNLSSPHKKGLHIQRDIFNKHGLESVSEDRMVSLKIVDTYQEIYGVGDKNEFNSHSKFLSSIQLTANTTSEVQLDIPCVVFSEFETLELNNNTLPNSQAFKSMGREKISLSSKVSQRVFIYSPDDLKI